LERFRKRKVTGVASRGRGQKKKVGKKTDVESGKAKKRCPKRRRTASERRKSDLCLNGPGQTLNWNRKS